MSKLEAQVQTLHAANEALHQDNLALRELFHGATSSRTSSSERRRTTAEVDQDGPGLPGVTIGANDMTKMLEVNGGIEVSDGEPGQGCHVRFALGVTPHPPAASPH